ARFSELWGFPVPATRGLTAPEMVDAAYERRLDVLVSVGGNFLEILPDPAYVREAMERVPLRVHMDIVPSTQMLLDAGEAVIILPGDGNYPRLTVRPISRRLVYRDSSCPMGCSCWRPAAASSSTAWSMSGRMR